MTAQAAIVLNDGQSTPVAHTFAPKGARQGPDKKDVALWRDQSPVNSVGFLTLTETHTPPNGNGMEKFRYVLDVPTLEQASSGGLFDPPPTRAYGTIGAIEVWAHARASDQELKDIAAYVKNFTATTYFRDAIVNREPAW
jgi:hypothetical protein